MLLFLLFLADYPLLEKDDGQIRQLQRKGLPTVQQTGTFSTYSIVKWNTISWFRSSLNENFFFMIIRLGMEFSLSYLLWKSENYKT